MTAALVIYWDYDTQYGAERSRTGAKSWGPLEVPNTERLLDVLAEYDVKTTFACVGRAAIPGRAGYSSPDQIRKIHALGHEVASHSFEHDFLPALSHRQLRDSLLQSRLALEDCIGARVVGFVPPYNEPTCCLRTGAVSLSAIRRSRFRWENTVDTVCKALADTGYEVYRVPDWRKWATVWFVLTKTIWPRPVWPKKMYGITCLALNSFLCFSRYSLELLQKTVDRGGLCVVYAHPHSLTIPEQAHMQGEGAIRTLLDLACKYRKDGRLEILTAREAARIVPD